MKKLLHLSHTDIMHDSRILKEMKAAQDSGYLVQGIGIKLEEGTVASSNYNNISIVAVNLFFKKLTYLPKPVRHLLTLFEFFVRTFSIAKKVRPDIIHCNDTLVLPVAVFLKFFTKAKLVYDAHELESNRNGLSRFLGMLTLLLEKFLWRFVDGLVVVSPSIEQWYLKNIGQKLSAIVFNSPVLEDKSNDFQGYDQESYLRNRFCIPSDSKIFIYIGILGEGRGIPLILDSFKNKNSKSHLVFLGYGEMSDYLVSVSREFHNIHVHEAVSHDKVIKVAKSADVGLCLIENVSLSDYYCLPNKLFEYCFSGIPVLASNFPDIAHLVKQYNVGLVTDLDSVFVEKAIHDFQNGEVTCNFSVEDLRPLSWSVQADNLINLYSKVLGKNI